MSNEAILAIIAGVVTSTTGVGLFIRWLVVFLLTKTSETYEGRIKSQAERIERQQEREDMIMPAMKNVVDAVENITATIDATHTEQKSLRKNNEQITRSLEDIKGDLRVLRKAWELDEDGQ